jgi:type II secretory pathway pseudopilin PulG
MVSRGGRRERGTTVLEMMAGLAVLGILLGAALVVESRDFRFSRESHDRAAALRACAARLEEYAAGLRVPAPGERSVDLPEPLARRFPGAAARESVRAAGDGLVEVEVRVEWRSAGGEPRSALLATLFAVEAAR